MLGQYYDQIPRKVISSGKLNDTVGAVSFEEATEACINFISEQRTQEKDIVAVSFNEMSAEEIAAWHKKNEAHIYGFVTSKKPKVYAPFDQSQLLSDNVLIDYLKREINQYGILTDILSDPKTDEVRINSYKDILIERGGKSIKAYDPQNEGKRLEFSSPQACTNFINRLAMFSNQSVSESAVHSTVTVSTPEGWRLQAFGPAAVSSEHGSTVDMYQKSAVAVIRLHSSDPLPIETLVGYYTLSDEMAHFLALCGKYRLTTGVFGDLGSGKTTLLQAVVDKIPNDVRMTVLERASELKCRRFDADGYMMNDVLCLSYEEYMGDQAKNPHINSIQNIQAGVLRASAMIDILGEILKDQEFAFALEAMATIPVIFTAHATSPEEVCFRFAEACLSSRPGQTKESVLHTVCSALGIVVIASKMKDGSRRVTSIAEIQGTQLKGGTVVPRIKMLYEFKQQGYVKETGHVYGYHVRVGNISDELFAKMSRTGMDIEDIQFLKRPVTEETHLLYNGKPSPYETIPEEYLNPKEDSSVPTAIDQNEVIPQVLVTEETPVSTEVEPELSADIVSQIESFNDLGEEEL